MSNTAKQATPQEPSATAPRVSQESEEKQHHRRHRHHHCHDHAISPISISTPYLSPGAVTIRR